MRKSRISKIIALCIGAALILSILGVSVLLALGKDAAPMVGISQVALGALAGALKINDAGYNDVGAASPSVRELIEAKRQK